MDKKKVIVFTFDMWRQQQLEDKLNEIINSGYVIQDSNLMFYQGDVSGVYVFTLNERLDMKP